MKSLPVSPLAPPLAQTTFPTHWTTWSVGWTLNQHLTRESDISQRSVQKTSGLFNEGSAVNDRLAVISDTKPSAADLLTVIDNGNDVLTWGLDDISLGDMLGSDMDPMAEASLDSFIDLSSYLMENTVSAMDDVGDAIAVVMETVTSPKKRSFEIAESVELVDVEDEVVMATTSDHDYVSKKPRLSSLSEASDVGFTDVEPEFTTPVTPALKYRQRRNKNNVASKRSREIRKQKYSEMDVKSEQLKSDNEKLRNKIVELEKLAKEMKSTLVSKLAGK